MKKYILFCLVMLISIVAKAQDILSVSDIIVKPGEEWCRMNVKLLKKNIYTAFQLDIEVPKGLEVSDTGNYDDEGNLIPSIILHGNDTHAISANEYEKGKFRVIAYSTEKKTFDMYGYSDFLSITFRVLDNWDGDSIQEIKLSNISFTDQLAVDHKFDDLTYRVYYGDYYRISLSTDTTMGSVEYLQGGDLLKANEVVEVKATPKLGYKFRCWNIYNEDLGEGTYVKENPYTFPVTYNSSVYADFGEEYYDVVFDVDGVRVTYKYTYAQTIKPVADPKKEGYTFTGWNPEFVEGATVPIGGITYTAQWKINSYMLRFVVDGEVVDSTMLEYGEEITREMLPTKEGHTFTDWFAMPKTMPARDITITGKFTANIYKVTYVVDGEKYKTTSVVYGTSIPAEPSPTKKGHSFSGWSEIPVTMPAHDITITGSFTVNTYKVTYIVDGEEYKTVSYFFGENIVLEPEPSSKEGYTFSGWSEIPETMPANDITVTGKFTVNTYIVTYIVDGEEYKTDSVVYGASIPAEPSPNKEGHTFSGWSEIPKTMPAHDITVTGSFTINSYKLTYYVDDIVYKTEVVKYGANITPLEEPFKEGFTFSGWIGLPDTMPAYDVDVKGSFNQNIYNLIYKIDGKVYKTVPYFWGEKIVREPEPTKEGYTFSGWSEIPETMPADNITITGSFTINSYMVTYIVDGEEYKTIEVVYGESIPTEPEPTKEGYTFSGWSKIPDTMPAHDIIVTGSFTVLVEILDLPADMKVDVYNINGMRVAKGILVKKINRELPNGFYIINGKKILLK